MNAEQAWRATLGELELQLTRATFDTWLKNTYVVGFEDNTFLIGVYNGYAKDWLENRLLTAIKRTLTSMLSCSVDVRFVVRPKGVNHADEEAALLSSMGDDASSPAGSRPDELSPARYPQRPDFDTGLNPNHTFDTFIVGSANRLANAAAKAVAENPGKSYNPLFIYGGVGLGKTHLLHAIGNMALGRTSKVLYVSSETFTNDLINAIRTQSTEHFRAKYRNHIDILLIDDIQFIGGKESTQEEFFHTFNALHELSRQIVLSSDRPPRAIVTLEERLRSRFECGLIADIQPPDLETRTAILRSKADSQPVSIPSEVLDFIAAKVQSNIRELQGALNRVVALAQLLKVELSVDIAASALEAITARSDSLSSDQVLQAVGDYFEVSVTELQGRKRSQSIALARHVAMYLLREELHCSLPQIGEILGGRDHTTILYGCEKITAGIEEVDQLRRDVLTVRERLYRDRVRV
jgi:chromosomal replication initiator protein